MFAVACVAATALVGCGSTKSEPASPATTTHAVVTTLPPARIAAVQTCDLYDKLLDAAAAGISNTDLDNQVAAMTASFLTAPPVIVTDVTQFAEAVDSEPTEAGIAAAGSKLRGDCTAERTLADMKE